MTEIPLAMAIDRTRCQIAASQTPKQRIQLLWAGAKAARQLAASDVLLEEFMRLAIEIGLIDANGCWIANVRDSVRRFGKEDVEHVLRWALRDMNPFEKGRL
jgi:hypothetical protein